MKKIVLALAVLASISMSASANNGKTRDAGKERKHPMKELNLSDDQQKQIKNLDQTYQVKRKEMAVAYHQDVEKVLTPEQKAKWEASKKERSERKAHKGGKTRSDAKDNKAN